MSALGAIGATHNIEVTFNSTDPQIQAMLRELNNFPEWSAERADCEWFLYTVLAKAAARRADHLRYLERRRH